MSNKMKLNEQEVIETKVETPPVEEKTPYELELEGLRKERKVREEIEVEKRKVLRYKLQDQKIADSRMVTGRFTYNELKKGVLEFMHKKYEGEDSKKYVFQDGEIYTIPVGVAHHINNNVGYEVIGNRIDAKGATVSYVAEIVRRGTFSNLDF